MYAEEKGWTSVLYETSKGRLPVNADKVQYVFYDFETTQNQRYSDTAKAHVRKLVSVQQFCGSCEDMEGGIDCERCGKWGNSFWHDSVGDLLRYLCEPRVWANKIVSIAQSMCTLYGK